jgi:hypothetical protein
VGSGGWGVQVAKATKHPKITVHGRFVVEQLKRCGVWCFSGGKTVDEEGGRGQGLDPVVGWHERVNKEGSYGVLNSTEHTLSLPILRGCVQAGQSRDNVVVSQKVGEGGIDELSVVVSLEGFNRESKLSANVWMKSGDGMKNIILLF